MLKISAKQMAMFDTQAANGYVDRLVAEAEQKLALKDGAGAPPERDASWTDARQAVMAVLGKAQELGIRCEGDLTPFFRMAMCDAPEFRQTGLYPMAIEIVSAKQYAAEQRMDALYSLLPDELRAEIFGEGR